MEHREVAVDRPYRTRFLLHRDPAIDLRRASGEYRQLQLRHPSLLLHIRLALQLHSRLIPFSSADAIHWATSGGLTMETEQQSRPQYRAIQRLICCRALQRVREAEPQIRFLHHIEQARHRPGHRDLGLERSQVRRLRLGIERR